MTDQEAAEIDLGRQFLALLRDAAEPSASGWRKAIVFDIETLDTRQSAVILTIGAAVIDFERAVVAASEIAIDLHQPGRTTSAETVGWWRGDEEKGVIDKNRHVVFDPAPVIRNGFVYPSHTGRPGERVTLQRMEPQW